MTSVALHPQSDCAPHAIRKLSMALAISLNLIALLITLQPLPLLIMHPPSIQLAIDATILQRPIELPQPPLPILRPVRHITHPLPIRSVPHPIPSAPTDVAPSTPISSVQTPISLPAVPVNSVASADTGSGSSDATIAYATATPPAYPFAAARNGVQGTVLLRVLVDENGHPLQVILEHSSGSRALDQAAREHVLAAWHFHPAQRNGHAVRAWALVPVNFKLDNR